MGITSMNRRELITGVGIVAVAVCGGRVVAGNAFALEPLCDNQMCVNLMCVNFLEITAREMMEETGEWKQAILKSRTNKRMLVTHRGCCGCEIALLAGANHPDWKYTRRNLTPSERESFHAQYGQQASFLRGLQITPTMQIRGFILNGRQEGWNYSVRQNA